MAIVTGLLLSLLTLSSNSGSTEPHILAFLLALTGIGLRIEAAIIEART
ncbi:hypothetical protein ACH4T9_21530 [Micromonospora sp. NPDC020750]